MLGFAQPFLWLVDLYISFLLLAVVLFSAKVGQDALEIGFHRTRSFLPAQGHPNQVLVCDDQIIFQCILPYFAWNLPLAAIFIVQHSVLKRPLQRFGSGRRVYSFTSALCLHLFMAFYKDLEVEGLSLDLAHLGISSWRHFSASSAVILVSFVTFAAHRNGSWFRAILFGDFTKTQGGCPRCPVNMDVFTGMGICVYKELGWTGFLLFNAFSIIPRRITLGDVVMRLCAGIYLWTMKSGHRRSRRCQPRLNPRVAFNKGLNYGILRTQICFKQIVNQQGVDDFSRGLESRHPQEDSRETAHMYLPTLLGFRLKLYW